MRTTNDEKKTILYYPTIKIKDGTWLRNAILYWDKVSSIVPGMNFDDFNSIEIEYLEDAGIYEPIYPFELQEKPDLCEEFCEQVKMNLLHDKRAISNRRVSHVHVEKVNMTNMVHIDKTPERILDYLLDEGIAKRNCDGTWINMNTQDADIYMATLAKYLAKVHRNTEIGTDSGIKFFYPYSRGKGEKDVEKQVYLDVALQKILPVPYMNIPLSDIIDFRKRYERELNCFRRRIEDFQWSLKQCGCIEDIQERTIILRRQIDDDLMEIEELMNSRGIRRAKKTMRTLIPIGITTGIELLAANGGLSPVESAVLGSIVGVTSSFFCANESSQIKDSNAYLFYERENGFISPTRQRREILR